MRVQTIMLQVGDWRWTLLAVHYACLLAHRTNAAIALVKLVPRQYLIWLPTPLDSRDLTEQDRIDLLSYAGTMEQEGIRYSVVIFRYFTALARGISEAADEVNAQVVFAALPDSPIPYWHQLEAWRLKRRLARHRRLLVDDEWMAAHLVADDPSDT